VYLIPHHYLLLLFISVVQESLILLKGNVNAKLKQTKFIAWIFQSMINSGFTISTTISGTTNNSKIFTQF